MRIATWNVNSVRQRLERLTAWLGRASPDVVALQETKVVDGDFPRAPLEALGYHVETFGQPTYNGVALLSKQPLTDVVRGFPEEGAQASRRMIAATVGGVRVVNVYVPNGESVQSDKFPYKLGWLARLESWLAASARPTDPLVLLGDFNIAPEDRDVHDPEAWRGQVLFHPKEHAALRRLLAWGLVDLLREKHPEPGHFTWWDYRALAFPRGHGLRIDLILGTRPVAARLKDCIAEREMRKGEKASDHVAVVADLA